MSAILVYVTCSSQDEARILATRLLQENLVACANILPPHTAVYEWNGKTEMEEETAMLLKSTSDLYDKLENAIRSNHSYDVPCIIQIPIEKGYKPFVDWITSCCTRDKDL